MGWFKTSEDWTTLFTQSTRSYDTNLLQIIRHSAIHRGQHIKNEGGEDLGCDGRRWLWASTAFAPSTNHKPQRLDCFLDPVQTGRFFSVWILLKKHFGNVRGRSHYVNQYVLAAHGCLWGMWLLARCSKSLVNPEGSVHFSPVNRFSFREDTSL